LGRRLSAIIRALTISAAIIGLIAFISTLASVASLALTLSSINIESFSVQRVSSGVSLLAELELRNSGVLEVSIDSISVEVVDSLGDKVGGGEADGVKVSPGSKAVLNIPINIQLKELSKETLENLLYNDQTLKAIILFKSSVKPFIRLAVDAELRIDWGAPIHGLKIGSPTPSLLNNTHMLVEIPLSFKNRNSYIGIDAVANISILDDRGSRMGYGALRVKAGPSSSYSDTAKIVAKLPSPAEGLLLNDTLLSYNVVLEIADSSGLKTTISRKISYMWGAPLKGFKLGEPTFKPYNDTHLTFSLPISFKNNNEHISLDGLLRLVMYNASTGELVGSGALSIYVGPGSYFSGEVVGLVKIPAPLEELLLKGSKLRYRMVIEGLTKPLSFRLEREVIYELRPLIKGINVSSSYAKPYNPIHVAVAIPVSIGSGPSEITPRGIAYVELYEMDDRQHLQPRT